MEVWYWLEKCGKKDTTWAMRNTQYQKKGKGKLAFGVVLTGKDDKKYLREVKVSPGEISLVVTDVEKWKLKKVVKKEWIMLSRNGWLCHGNDDINTFSFPKKRVTKYQMPTDLP